MLGGEVLVSGDFEDEGVPDLAFGCHLIPDSGLSESVPQLFRNSPTRDVLRIAMNLNSVDVWDPETSLRESLGSFSCEPLAHLVRTNPIPYLQPTRTDSGVKSAATHDLGFARIEDPEDELLPFKEPLLVVGETLASFFEGGWCRHRPRKPGPQMLQTEFHCCIEERSVLDLPNPENEVLGFDTLRREVARHCPHRVERNQAQAWDRF
jgi:hypothetical protein